MSAIPSRAFVTVLTSVSMRLTSLACPRFTASQRYQDALQSVSVALAMSPCSVCCQRFPLHVVERAFVRGTMLLDKCLELGTIDLQQAVQPGLHLRQNAGLVGLGLL